MKSTVRNAAMVAIARSRSLFGRSGGDRVVMLHETPDAVRFGAFLDWLSANGDVVPLRALIDTPHTNSARRIAITFDDGYASWFEVAAPELTARGLPATFFVTSGLVGLERDDADAFVRTRLRRTNALQLLSRSQLDGLAARADFDIGGHTVNHLDLGRQAQPMLTAEIADDRRRLEDWTGRPVTAFAYPFGEVHHISDAVVGAVRAAGYDVACVSVPGPVLRSTPRLRVPRVGVSYAETPRVWRARLEGGFDAVYRLKHRLKRS